MKNKELILEYLKNKPATIRDLMDKTGKWINSPQEYIRQLREEGHNIETIPVEGQRYSVYKLHLEEQPELFQ